jgi:hypothetical protein
MREELSGVISESALALMSDLIPYLCSVIAAHGTATLAVKHSTGLVYHGLQRPSVGAT